MATKKLKVERLNRPIIEVNKQEESEEQREEFSFENAIRGYKNQLGLTDWRFRPFQTLEGKEFRSEYDLCNKVLDFFFGERVFDYRHNTYSNMLGICKRVVLIALMAEIDDHLRRTFSENETKRLVMTVVHRVSELL